MPEPTNIIRPFNPNLHEAYHYVPAMSPPDEGHFDENQGWVPGKPQEKWDEDWVKQIEAFKVKVWRDGGPRRSNDRVSDYLGPQAKAVETCESEKGCIQYSSGRLKSCYKCDKKVCPNCRHYILEEFVCLSCERKLWDL